MNRLAIVVACLCVALASMLPTDVSAQQPERFHSEQYGYSIEIPEGWQRIPQTDVEQTFARVIKPGRPFMYEAAYEPSSNPTPFVGPYILLQVTPYENLGGSQPNESEIKAVLREMGELDVMAESSDAMTDEVTGYISGAEMGVVDYDPDTRTYSTKMELQTAFSGPTRAQIQGRFGHEAMVQLNYYTPASEWEDHRATYEKTARSFEFDEDAAYKDGLWQTMPGLVRSMIIGGLIGLLFGLGGLVVRVIRGG